MDTATRMEERNAADERGGVLLGRMQAAGREKKEDDDWDPELI